MNPIDIVLGTGWGIYLNSWERNGKGTKGHAEALKRLKREYGHLNLTARQWTAVSDRMYAAVAAGSRLNRTSGETKVERTALPLNRGIPQLTREGEMPAVYYRIRVVYTKNGIERQQSFVIASERTLTREQINREAIRMALEWNEESWVRTGSEALRGLDSGDLQIGVVAAMRRSN